MTDNAQAIAADKWEIVETLARYSFAVDFGNWGERDAVFAEDATAHYDMEAIGHGSVHLNGRTEIVAWLSASIPALGPQLPRHAMTNHLFDINGDKARTRSYLVAGRLGGGGIYTVDHIRTGHGWRVKHFHLTNFKRNPD